MDKPDIVERKHLIYLDNLRSSGETNMYGAGEYLEEHFEMSKIDARIVLRYWMDTFGIEKGEA